MEKLIAYLTSPTFGFLLKLFAGIASATFGIIGLGAKTRGDDKKLTRNGWIALVGIVVAMLLGIGSLVYDFVSGQRRAQAERQRAERLMLSVQRGIYPLRGIKMSFELPIGSDFEPLASYKKNVREQISGDRECSNPQRQFGCYGSDGEGKTYLYSIRNSSALFPKDPSPVMSVLKSLYIFVAFYKNSPQAESPQGLKYLGRFFARCNDLSEPAWLMYNYNENALAFGVDDCALPDSEVGNTGVYSLVEFFPGVVTATAKISDGALCNELKLDVDPCIKNVFDPLKSKLSVRELRLKFSYPKSLWLSNAIAANCGGSLALRLPADIESLDSLGNIEPAERQNHDPQQTCKLIDSAKQ